MQAGTNIVSLLETLAGAGFVGMDTEVKVALSGGKGNPMQGRVTKRSIGHHVQVFTNTNSNGYANMVKRRLGKEGKDPANFELSPRQWGTRIPNLPIVQHPDKKTQEVKHYLEVIFIKGGVAEYLLDGEPIERENVIGLKPETVDTEGQGGLEDKVVIRTFSLESLRQVRYDGITAIGPFYYEAE